MTDCTFDPAGFFTNVFGSWPNATQGVFGAFVGVVGAYGVAVWTTRKASEAATSSEARCTSIATLASVSALAASFGVLWIASAPIVLRLGAGGVAWRSRW